MEEPMQALVVRIPVSLHKAVKKKAASQDRSMAEHIRHVLKEDVKR